MVKLVKRVARGTAARVLFRQNRPLNDWGGQVYRLRATGEELMRWDYALDNPPGTPYYIRGRGYVVHSTADGGDTVLLDPAPVVRR